MRVPVIPSISPSLAPLVEAAIQSWPSELERADMRAQPNVADCVRPHAVGVGVELRFHTDRNPGGYRLAWVRRSMFAADRVELAEAG